MAAIHTMLRSFIFGYGWAAKGNLPTLYSYLWVVVVLVPLYGTPAFAPFFFFQFYVKLFLWTRISRSKRPTASCCRSCRTERPQLAPSRSYNALYETLAPRVLRAADVLLLSILLYQVRVVLLLYTRYIILYTYILLIVGASTAVVVFNINSLYPYLLDSITIRDRRSVNSVNINILRTRPIRALLSKILPGRGGMVPGILVPEMQVHRLEITTARRALAGVLDEQSCGEKTGWRFRTFFSPVPAFDDVPCKVFFRV